MPFVDLQKFLSILVGTTVERVDSCEAPGQASVQVAFSDGSTLRSDYWRVINGSTPSSFDHGQKYGFKVPINAIEQLRGLLGGDVLEAARFNSRTGDLVFGFRSGNQLHAFNFTGYEVWEIRFPDGTAEYSNNAFESPAD